MTTHTASRRCEQLKAMVTGEFVRVSVWEELKHE
jgi:hypothetical protein